jgi:hypothetical protein
MKIGREWVFPLRVKELRKTLGQRHNKSLELTDVRPLRCWSNSDN